MMGAVLSTELWLAHCSLPFVIGNCSYNCDSERESFNGKKVILNSRFDYAINAQGTWHLKSLKFLKAKLR